MFIKENFWVGAKGGILEEKHYFAMRESIWLYLYLLLKQTGIAESGEGIVNYGHPLTRKQIQDDTGFHERRIEDWIDRLRRTKYIRTESQKNLGLIFFIMAAKNKSKVAHNNVPPKPEVAHNNVPRHPLKRATLDDNLEKNQQFESSPTIFSTKDLSYYNKDAAAKSAAVGNLSQFVKSIPREKTQKELDARRRLLLDQADMIRKKGVK